MPCNGPVIPFGAMVESNPISAKDLSRLRHFGPKVLPSIFFGYALHAGRVWKGDVMIADIEELEEMDASEIHARRLIAKDVLAPMKGDKIYFPSRTWNSPNLWERAASDIIHIIPGSSRTRRGTISFPRRLRRTLFCKPSSR